MLDLVEFKVKVEGCSRISVVLACRASVFYRLG